jgi:hypothetical protein
MKLVSAIALMSILMAGAASAATTISVSDAYKTNDGSTSNEVVNANIAQTLKDFSFVPAPLKGFTVDANFQDDVNRVNKPSVQKYDVGAKVSVFGPVYIRGAIGYDVNGGPRKANDFSYWSVTTGASVPATQFVNSPLLSKVSLDGSIRYRNAFSSLNNFSTFTFKGGVSYAILPSTKLRAYIARETGDRNNVEAGLGVVQSF